MRILRSSQHAAALLALSIVSLTAVGCGSADPTEPSSVAPQAAAFETPEAAVAAIASVVGTGDTRRVEEIFGPDGVDLLRSGDDVADRNAAARVKAQIEESVAFEDGADGSKVALFGHAGWPFPVPLVRAAEGWRFDVAAGWEEIQNRRVGRNELSTIHTLHEFVDSQREYASAPRDGNPPSFAQRILSSEGKHDGLYWPAGDGEPQSPFGPEVAAAAAEGYRKSDAGPTPFHGYKFRLLTAQGASAPGGARSYLDSSGRLTRGFAALAWPAKYGNSGVMTFLVNQQGVVFQRDLGEDTEALVAQIGSYDPDSAWEPARQD